MEALGINPVLLIAQIISFGILLFILNKFLYKKIRKALEDRREAVRQAITMEEQTQKRLKQIEENDAKREKQNQVELRALREEAKKAADDLKKQILADADLKGQKIIENAKVRIDQETLQAQEELKKQASVLAMAMTEKVLGEKLASKTAQKKELDKSIVALKNAKH